MHIRDQKTEPPSEDSESEQGGDEEPSDSGNP